MARAINQAKLPLAVILVSALIGIGLGKYITWGMASAQEVKRAGYSKARKAAEEHKYQLPNGFHQVEKRIIEMPNGMVISIDLVTGKDEGGREVSTISQTCFNKDGLKSGRCYRQLVCDGEVVDEVSCSRCCFDASCVSRFIRCKPDCP